jgi:rSAM/selenodomain-associated transferase 1
MPQTRNKHSPVNIAILSRAPIAGQTKTRLIPALGAEGAADLHQRLLQRTVQTALAAKLGPVHLWCTPDTEHPAFTACQQRGPLTLHTQATGDLGARMLATLAANTPTLIIGTDCPALTPAHLQQAANALNENDAVLIPAEDGGYVLIGLRQPEPALFANLTWGNSTVLEQTRKRLRAAGLCWAELPPLWDVDEPADLTRLTAFAPELLTPI